MIRHSYPVIRVPRIRPGGNSGEALIPARVPTVWVWFSVFASSWKLGRICEEQFGSVSFINNRRHLSAELGPNLHANGVVFDFDGQRHAPYLNRDRRLLSIPEVLHRIRPHSRRRERIVQTSTIAPPPWPIRAVTSLTACNTWACDWLR